MLPTLVYETLLLQELKDDLGLAGDVTVRSLGLKQQQAKAILISKKNTIVAGIAVGRHCLSLVDPSLKIETHHSDGDWVSAGTPLLSVTGSAASILMAERTCLNIMQRMSGIALATHTMQQAIRHTHARILCTRKTVCGLRALDKWAVTIGGGSNHRLNLSQSILIKDNHIALFPAHSLRENVLKALSYANHTIPVEVEVDTLLQLKEILSLPLSAVLLDNMTPDMIREAVAMVNKRFPLEASGGVNLHNLVDIAETGVDYISSGALTHSTQSVDLSLELQPLL